MAQVKKFQPGGKLTINGKDYTIDQINEYMNSGGFSSQERAALAGTIQSIAGGASRTFDRNANSISGDEVTDDFVDFYGSEKKAEKNKGRSTRWANRQARRNSDHHVVNSALERLGGIEDYYNNKNKKSKEDTKSNNVIRKGSGFFKYDDNGQYLDNSENFGYMDIIDRAFKYLGSEDRSSWNTDAFTDTELAWLHDWYNENVGYDTGLKERIKNGRLNDVDKNLLAAFGLSQEQITDIEQKQQRLFQDKGYDYKAMRPYFEFNDKGQLVARTIDGKSVFSPFGGNGNYWFNESFVKNNPQYQFLKDHFLINGVLYNSADALNPESDLYKFLRQSGGFYDLNKSGDWIGANNIIRQYWDGKDRFNYALASESPVASDYFYANPTHRWSSVTGAYDVQLNPGEQLLEVYDPSQETDAFGQGKTKYIVLDSDGKYIRDLADPGNLTGNAAEALSGRQIINKPGSIYHGMEIYHPTNGGITFYWDPKTKRLIYEGEILNATNTEGKNYAFPSEIAEILMSNPKFIDNLLKSGKLSKFKRTLGATINTGVRDWTFGLLANEMDVKDWRELGFVEPGVAEKLQDYFDDLKKNNRYGSTSERRRTRLVDMQKMGGKMRYISKFQPGGTIGTTETKAFTERKIDGPIKDTRNFANIGDDPFTASDWLELGGLATDLVSLGVGFSGAPIASGVVGAIGSTASFASDVNRDGLDWGDVGNYALNLGLDLVSAIPFAGGAAQSVKAAGKIKKAAKTVGKFLTNPWVIRSLSGMGIGNAVKISAEKIINGEEWTVRDIRNVANGLSGIMTLKKAGLFGGGAQKQDVGEINVKIKGKDTKVILEEEDLKKILSGSKDDVDKKLREIIVEKYPKIGRAKTKTSDIDFSPAKIEEKLGLKFWKGKQPTGEYDFNLTTKTVEPKLTPEGLSSGNQSKERFLHFLRTGEWKAVNSAGDAIIDATNQLRGAKPNREMLRQASFVIPNMWAYSEQEQPVQAGFIAKPTSGDPYAYHFKKGGKITKHQNTSIMPGTFSPKLKLGNIYQSQLNNLQQSRMPYGSQIKVDFNRANGTMNVSNIGYAPSHKASTIDFMTGKTVANPNSPVDYASTVTKRTINTPMGKYESEGSKVGESNKSGLGWKIAGNMFGVGAKAGSALYASKRQMDLVNEMKPFQEQYASEHSFRYRDPGIDLAYDKAIGQHQSYARNFRSANPELNAAVGLQTADKTSQLELERGLKKAQFFGEQQTQHQNLLQQEAQNRTAVVNRNLERDYQMDAYKRKMKGAYIAQNEGIIQGAINDLQGIGTQATASVNNMKKFDLQNEYADAMAKWRTDYNSQLTNGVHPENLDLNSWMNKYHKKDILDYQRRAIGLSKKGGRIRPTSEQIKIDNNKLRAKAIQQLSKQAFDLLKMALS